MKYVQVTRSDVEGNYTQQPKEVCQTLEAELDDIQYLAPGTQIILTVVEMTPEQYEALPEFDGW